MPTNDVIGVVIEPGPARLAHGLAQETAEFKGSEPLYPLAEFERRLSGASALCLIASVDDTAVGFKAGYDRYGDGSWYSWMGAIAASHRRAGLARRLLERQEAWVQERGYRCLYVKTRNRHVGMICLLLQSGYQLVQIEPRAERSDSRLLLQKQL